MTASDDDLIQKGQDDLIRRGDARRILEEEGFLERSLANLNNLPAVQVGVKPMEWLEIHHGQYFEARVIGILYSVRLGTDGISRWQAGHMGTWRDAPTIEAAKADAQADYDARIRSALTAQPSPDVEALVALLAEARTDLAAYVDADWPEHQRSNYPPIQAKWKRDMELCWQIDAALAPRERG